jgi:hypothetical protein
MGYRIVGNEQLVSRPGKVPTGVVHPILQSPRNLLVTDKQAPHQIAIIVGDKPPVRTSPALLREPLVIELPVEAAALAVQVATGSNIRGIQKDEDGITGFLQ